MTSELSPIIDYYPLDLKTDLNGKQQDWEAVVLIPFIDEVNIIHAPILFLSELKKISTLFFCFFLKIE